jgi:hypothetical protein
VWEAGHYVAVANLALQVLSALFSFGIAVVSVAIIGESASVVNDHSREFSLSSLDWIRTKLLLIPGKPRLF